MINEKKKMIDQPVGSFVGVHAAQTDRVEEFTITASDETRMTVDTGDQPTAVAGNGESIEI